METIKKEKRFFKTDINSLVKEICTKHSISIEQPIFRFQVSFYVIFNKEGYNVDDIKETYFELVNDTFLNLKMIQIIELENLDQIDTETGFNSCVEI